MGAKMFKYRKTLDKIKNYLNHERIVILLGARQVGKTTLMKMIQEDLQHKSHYLNMEDPEKLQILIEGVAGLKQRGLLTDQEKLYLFIDEFHYLEDPNRLFKEIYDDYPLVSIVASGSASLEIQHKIKESLTGRKLTVNVFPLDFHEYLQFTDEERAKFIKDVDPEGALLHSKKIAAKATRDIFRKFILFGGLPQIVIEGDEEMKKIRLQEIFDTYIQKDIKGILKNIEIATFNQMLQIIASQIGNLLNVSELSNTLGLSRNQIVFYLEVLRETFVNFLLKPHYTNVRKEVSKTPKTFFYDNGVRNQMLKQFAPLELRADNGALLENAVFMELIKNLPVSQDIKYWRTKNKTEVDFIIRKDESLYPIEVKLKDVKEIPLGLKSFAESHNVKTAFIINDTEWFSKKEGNIAYYFIPHFLAGKIPSWISTA